MPGSRGQAGGLGPWPGQGGGHPPEDLLDVQHQFGADAVAGDQRHGVAAPILGGGWLWGYGGDEDPGICAPLSPSSLPPHLPHPLPGEPRHPGAIHADPCMPRPPSPSPHAFGVPPTPGSHPPLVWPYSRCWAAAGAGGHGAGEKRGQLVMVPANGEEVEREGSPPPGNAGACQTHPRHPHSKNNMLHPHTGPKHPSRSTLGPH